MRYRGRKTAFYALTEMRYWVGVTDNKWFDFLRYKAVEEVNFWQPSASSRPHRLSAGELFLFKLKNPRNCIAGGAFFASYSALPAQLAWNAFGELNGVSSDAELLTRIQKYRSDEVAWHSFIGCSILVEPFFFSENDWLNVPDDWHPNIQKGRYYDTNTMPGANLWKEISRKLANSRHTQTKDALNIEERYGAPFLSRARLGQGTFRVLVTDAYSRRCAITTERTLPVLEAAHIKPYGSSGPHSVNNGLLLRSDLHKLFDSGYMTITNNLRVEVSKRIKEEFENGREYYRYHGKYLQTVPEEEHFRPHPDYLEWHQSQRFLG